MWADSWHSTEPHGGHSALSDSALAAVPLVTGKTRAVGCSNTSRTTVSSCAVTLVAAVGERGALVGGGHRGEDLGNDASGVVGTQLDLGHA